MDKYVTPRCDELFLKVSGATIFSKLDLRAGFMQIGLAPSTRDATSFWWRDKLYRFTRVPFGLINSTAWFQRRIDRTLLDAGCTSFAVAYVDDVLIYSTSVSEHLQHV